MKLQDLRKIIKEIYKEIPDAPNNEGDHLLCDILNIDLSTLYSYPEKDIHEKNIKEINDFLLKRMEGMPYGYILKRAYFYGRPFYVDSRVLIPRPETELSVIEICKLINDKKPKILEIGVGSGAVSITLSLEIPHGLIHGIDISEDALEVARINNLKLSGNVILWQSNLFENIKDRYHIIYSNPPYIERDTLINLSPSVVNFEPTLALDGGVDGLDFYRKIVKEGAKYLEEDGYFVFEIGYNQGEAVKEILNHNGFTHIKKVKDYQNYDRVLIAWR